MALTKLDLQQIKGVIKDEVRGVKDEVRGVKGELQGVKDEVRGVKGELQGVKDDVRGVKVELHGVRVEVKNSERRILKKLEIVSQTLDKQTMELAKRVDKIEDHLGIRSEN